MCLSLFHRRYHSYNDLDSDCHGSQTNTCKHPLDNVCLLIFLALSAGI